VCGTGSGGWQRALTSSCWLFGIASGALSTEGVLLATGGVSVGQRAQPVVARGGDAFGQGSVKTTRC